MSRPTFRELDRQLTALNYPTDVFVSPEDFQLIKKSTPVGSEIMSSTDALGEYIWCLRTRVRPKTADIPTIVFEGTE